MEVNFKYIIFILLQINLIHVGFCQSTKTIKLLYEKDSIGIEYAHIFIDDKLVTYSDAYGNFSIEIQKNFQYLEIKHLSYQTKKIFRNDLLNTKFLFMQEKEFLLDEIVITNNKKPKMHLLLPEKRAKEFFMKGLDVRFPYEFINAVYVPNEFKKGEHNIQNIIFESRKGDDNPKTKFIPFKVNLMTVDTITFLPKDALFNEDLTVGKRENQKLLKVDVSDYDIEFPKAGIFVVVSLYDQDYYESNGFVDRPGFGQTQTPKNSRFFELYWVPGKNSWMEPLYSKERIQCRNFGIEAIEN